MKIGIVGLPQVGKSTIFSLLTQTGANAASQDRRRANLGMGQVPDERIDRLSEMFHPRKTTYATIEFTDLPGWMPTNDGKSGSEFLEALKDVDALVHVLRAFEAPHVPHIEGDVNPGRDLETLHGELVLSDWSLVETRLARLEQDQKRNKKVGIEAEMQLLERCKEWFEEGRPLRSMALTEDERAQLRAYTFYTDKPVLIVVNLGDDQFGQDYFGRDKVTAWAQAQEVPLVEMGGLVEAEIAQLDPADRAPFMEDLGLQESGIERLARAAYAHLGLIAFFTVGEDEVRAWTIRKGETAREAAGKIHSDIARGFIRAEVTSYEDLMANESMTRLREKGLLRLEGKEYVVQDGDIMNFRFNV